MQTVNETKALGKKALPSVYPMRENSISCTAKRRSKFKFKFNLFTLISVA